MPSRASSLVVAALCAALAGPAAGCGGDDEPERPEPRRASVAIPRDALRGAVVAVGSKEFTEQVILGKLTVAALQAGGAVVEDRTRLGGSFANRRALRSGAIDAYWEYTGTGWLEHLGRRRPIRDPREQWRRVAALDRRNGIVWLAPSPANNTYAFAVRREAAAPLGLERISDLGDLIAARPQDATICIGREFRTRADGLPGVERAYGFRFPGRNVATLDENVIYTEVDRGGRCNVGEVFATDGRIRALGLEVLEDDRRFFPVYNPALNVRAAVVRRHPALRDIFAAIAARLDDATLRRLNARVDVDGLSEEDVAHGWLRDNGFLPG